MAWISYDVCELSSLGVDNWIKFNKHDELSVYLKINRYLFIILYFFGILLIIVEIQDIIKDNLILSYLKKVCLRPLDC